MNLQIFSGTLFKDEKIKNGVETLLTFLLITFKTTFIKFKQPL